MKGGRHGNKGPAQSQGARPSRSWFQKAFPPVCCWATSPKPSLAPVLFQSLAQAWSLGEDWFLSLAIVTLPFCVCVQLSFYISPQMLEVTCFIVPTRHHPLGTPTNVKCQAAKSGAGAVRNAPRGSQARISALLPPTLTISAVSLRPVLAPAPPHVSPATPATRGGSSLLLLRRQDSPLFLP